MRIVFLALVTVHGLIHAMGFAKAFGLAELTQLRLPISRLRGVLFLLAGASVLGSVVVSLAWPSVAYVAFALSAVLSQLAIVGSWSDAKAGTAANVLLVLGAVHGYATEGPTSFRAEFEREARTGEARVLTASRVTEADLARLPAPVRRYLRATGFVGQPRVRSYRLRFRGRIRSAADAPWMPFEAEQQSFVDPPMRLFFMRATMRGLPVEAYHRLADGHATMRVRLLGAIPLVDARGAVMDRSETVTLLNDMSLLAPGTLLEPTIAWEPVDDRTARARFTYGAQTVSATLTFGADGLLTNFVSDDRSRASADGRTFTRLRFSTPTRDYRAFGPRRIGTHGEARWHARSGTFTYGEFEVVEVAYGPTR